MIRILSYNLFKFFPIRRKKILLFSYYGAQYGDSPKYICQFLIQSEKDWDIVWAFTDLSVTDEQKIRKVKYFSLRFFYELATSQFIVTNFRLPREIKKRKNQFYIQTWHSSLRLKMIEKDAEEHLAPSYIEMAKEDSKKIDFLLAGCTDSKRIFEESFWYNGEILEIGTPRIDPLINSAPEKEKSIKKQLGVKEGNKVLFYAPTFRKGNNYESYIRNFDFIIKALEQAWGGEWTVLARLHPHLMNKSGEVFKDSQINDVTKYPDVQELLMISDFLVTDYSSMMFDFLFTKKPVLLFLPDLDFYLKNERNLYYDVEDLPFLKAYHTSEIEKILNNFDEESYHQNSANFIKKIGSFEDGKASLRLIEILKTKCKKIK